MIHSREDQPDAETEHFTKLNILRPFFSMIVEQIDKIDSQLQKSIKIDNHKKASDRFLSITIDFYRVSKISIRYVLKFYVEREHTTVNFLFST